MYQHRGVVIVSVVTAKHGYNSFCRCAVGDDWWYYGDRCQFKSSTQDGVVTAAVSSVVVFVVMVIVTVVSVVCLRNKYKKKVNNMGGGMTALNVHAN